MQKRELGPGPARVLPKPWPLLPRFALLEYESPARNARHGDGIRLAPYGNEWRAT